MIQAEIDEVRRQKCPSCDFVHWNNPIPVVAAIVEHDEDLLTISPVPKSEPANLIGRHIARLIEDGSTLQIGLDAASQATGLALSDKNDLGIHSQFVTEDIMHLYAKGVINNRSKGYNNGKLVASCAVGTQALYEFLHVNPAVDFYPTDYVNDIDIIARHNKMVSMNVAQCMDLAGQVSCDAVAYTLFAGVSGIPDFVRGSNRSPGGKSIIMLHSTTDDGKTSRIVPLLNNTIVTVPRDDVRHVVTEYGVVNLFGKSTQERALAMISIAHPDFRDELMHKAKQLGMIGAERSLGESVHGIYPVKIEETIVIDGEKIILRPAKPVDERRIQEHFYQLDRQDIVSRFFHEKKRFVRDDVEGMSQIDYIRNLTIVAVVGEFGFGRVVGVGEYYLEEAKNLAEIAFSVSKDYQGKKLGRILIRKLAEAARDPRNHGYSMSNGIANLRREVASKYLRQHGVRLDPDHEVIVCLGSKDGFSHLCLALMGPGDTAIVPNPYFPVHMYAVALAAGNVIALEVRDSEKLLSNISYTCQHLYPRPKLLILNYPSNPTGGTYSELELDFAANYARRFPRARLSGGFRAAIDRG